MNLNSLCTRLMDGMVIACHLDEWALLMLDCIEERRRDKDKRQRSHPIV